MESAAYPRDLVFMQTDETALRLSEQSYDNIADGGSTLLVSALTRSVGSPFSYCGLYCNPITIRIRRCSVSFAHYAA